ncbi:MAG: amidohydrolase family protein [Rhodobacteraceae bacterium]|nr:amidohydrolase family protein [Paracoccaceae bacterium]
MSACHRAAGGWLSWSGRWYPEECVSVEEAVYAYTVGAAYSVGMEGVQGKIAPGILADLTVLGADIFTVPTAAILTTPIAATMVGGEFVYGAENFGYG